MVTMITKTGVLLLAVAYCVVAIPTSLPSVPDAPEVENPLSNPDIPDHVDLPSKPDAPEIENPLPKPETPDHVDLPSKPDTPEVENPLPNPDTPDHVELPSKPDIPEAENPISNPKIPKEDNPLPEPQIPVNTPPKPDTPVKKHVILHTDIPDKVKTQPKPDAPKKKIQPPKPITPAKKKQQQQPKPKTSAKPAVLKAKHRFLCPRGQVLTSMQSTFDKDLLDRVWTFGCSPSKVRLEDCEWTDYENDADEEVDYECDGDCVITGVGSLYMEDERDRRWQFHVCDLGEDAEVEDCDETEWLNNYGQPLNFKLRPGQVIGGFYSEHDDTHEDRIFSIQVCDVELDD